MTHMKLNVFIKQVEKPLSSEYILSENTQVYNWDNH